MATKAQRFSARQQVDNSKAKSSSSKAKKKKANGAATKKADRHVGPEMAGVTGAGKATRNFSKRSNNKGGPALEISEAGKPSRKSTRSSAGRVKQATPLTRRQKGRTQSPKERAVRASVR